jgi:hypothetical protein
MYSVLQIILKATVGELVFGTSIIRQKFLLINNAFCFNAIDGLKLEYVNAFR